MHKGFTIVELLIVIVVIGILASISIVSYNGITQRANNTASESAANSVARKVQIYAVETGSYPYSTSDLTANPTATYYVPASITFTLGSTQPDTPSDVSYIKCGSGSPATQADINSGAGNLTGIRVYYWTYTDTPNADSYKTVGVDSGAGIACPAS